MSLRPPPAKSSWWIGPLSRVEFQERQQVANDRMNRKHVGTRVLGSVAFKHHGSSVPRARYRES